ncbi:hypothetical protein Q4508_16170 [Amphritea sp. 2_MG-2023]|uniref:hypothetical protein n=1 Tax=Amphritea TaxID=515417 RepID=UPI001C06FDF7|nr:MULTISPECIES: hypothetical protein [Amphritea]MBU2966875.1 hypothetical protein [Amphritea atlantica]MDO6420091.1 hypothetical protein [Amphritea sp. 2_MG-2023]
MKSFLRDNPTIAFGLGLPLLLVTLFLLASGLPTLLVAPPQNDLLFATEYVNDQGGLQIAVINRSVQLIDQGSRTNDHKPRIWRYDAKTGAVQEIAFVLPRSHSKKTPSVRTKPQRIDLPDLQGVNVDSSSIASDGYEFILNKRASSSLFGGLFYSSGYRYGAALSKNGRHIPLPSITNQYYRGRTHFIGWVLP